MLAKNLATHGQSQASAARPFGAHKGLEYFDYFFRGNPRPVIGYHTQRPLGALELRTDVDLRSWSVFNCVECIGNDIQKRSVEPLRVHLSCRQVVRQLDVKSNIELPGTTGLQLENIADD